MYFDGVQLETKTLTVTILLMENVYFSIMIINKLVYESYSYYVLMYVRNRYKKVLH